MACFPSLADLERRGDALTVNLNRHRVSRGIVRYNQVAIQRPRASQDVPKTVSFAGEVRKRNRGASQLVTLCHALACCGVDCDRDVHGRCQRTEGEIEWGPVRPTTVRSAPHSTAVHLSGGSCWG